MKKLTSKTLATTGITACLLGMVSSASFASISWDSYGEWDGSGGKAGIRPTLRKQMNLIFTMTVRG